MKALAAAGMATLTLAGFVAVGAGYAYALKHYGPIVLLVTAGAWAWFILFMAFFR